MPGAAEITTHTLETAEADIVYDVHGPLPTADGRPPLVMIGQPMCAEGFAALVPFFPDRTVVTYDVRGLGRSTVRRDGRTDHTPVDNAADVHAVIEAVGGGPVDLLGSSGGAITALELVRAHPGDVRVAVAHEPPLIGLLPDADDARAAEAAVQRRYHEGGFGAGMAAFIAMTSWQGEFTAAYLAQPAPEPAAFGLPAEDDGGRDDALLSGISNAVTEYEPDVDALRSGSTRVVVAHAEESGANLTGRASHALATLLGQESTEFPSHHGGFMGPERGGRPEAFAARLREVLAD
ncbi:MAG: alpha/beta hydrolase [Marmoricola sp.]|nr:alpha/beta hydrolase [Marmoricola sp.]